MNPEPPPFPAPHVVKPRRSGYRHHSVIAITDTEVMVENGLRVFPATQLPEILCSIPSAIIAVQGFGQHLQHLEHVYRNDPAFSYRVTPVYRYLRVKADGRDWTRAESVSTLCNYVGWQSQNKKANRYHYPLDPIHYAQGLTSIDELDDTNRPRLEKLYDWALSIREWCRRNDLTIKASAGGLAAQLLKDPRFYPSERRKAPKVINRIARPELPGNYYRLYAQTDRTYRTIYLDMTNAHHSAARLVKFPDVNSLHAYGDWSNPKPRIFAGPDSPLLKKPGLFHLRISSPGGRFTPPFMERIGESSAYVYSNELDLITLTGGHVLGIHAALVSDEPETNGLSQYAKFAIEEIRANPDYKPWLKPTLHAAYGLLAARPVPFETGFYRAKGGTPGEYPMGRTSVPVKIVRREAPIESGIVNVIHRGMIEAQVRKEVLRYAGYLDSQGYSVLSIYADSLFIRNNGREPPLLEFPWRIAGYVDYLRFISAVHFTSPSLSRLPGIPRTARERYLQTVRLAEHLKTPAEARMIRTRRNDRAVGMAGPLIGTALDGSVRPPL